MPEIFQCGECLRYWCPVPDGGCQVTQRPMGVLPVMGACGRSDCEGIARVIAEQESARARLEQQPVVDFWKRKRELCLSRKAGAARPGHGSRARGRSTGRANGRPHTMAQAAADLKPGVSTFKDRVLPPERDGDGSFDAQFELAGVVVGSSQKEFLAAVDVSEAHGLLFDYFAKRRGQWIPLVEIEAIEGCHIAHSRIAELRGLLAEGEDIDQKSLMYEPTGRLHSHYRLCAKAESERLQRRVKRDEAQPELMEGGR